MCSIGMINVIIVLRVFILRKYKLGDIMMFIGDLGEFVKGFSIKWD